MVRIWPCADGDVRWSCLALWPASAQHCSSLTVAITSPLSANSIVLQRALYSGHAQHSRSAGHSGGSALDDAVAVAGAGSRTPAARCSALWVRHISTRLGVVYGVWGDSCCCVTDFVASSCVPWKRFMTLREWPQRSCRCLLSARVGGTALFALPLNTRPTHKTMHTRIQVHTHADGHTRAYAHARISTLACAPTHIHARVVA